MEPNFLCFFFSFFFYDNKHYVLAQQETQYRNSQIVLMSMIFVVK